MPCAGVRRTARHRLRHVAASRGASRGASAPPAFSPFLDPAPVVSFGFPRRPSLGGPRQGGWAARPRCARSARPTYCANTLRQPTACSGRATYWAFRAIESNAIRGSSAAAAAVEGAARAAPGPAQEPRPGLAGSPHPRVARGGGKLRRLPCFLFHPFRDEPTVRQ